MRKSKVTWRIIEKELVIIVQERQVCKGLLRTRVELVGSCDDTGREYLRGLFRIN